ncbi:MAG: cyclic nucleotide-binding domain-containing protein [Treponema sp.]|nr:cyclic nucleotide-binding domain-containing protein [Treponema sp.]
MPHHTFDVTPIENAVLFSTLTEREREFVLAYSSVIQLRRGGRLFSSGEKALHFYILLEGSIRILQSRQDGPDEELARFTPGSIIGDFDFARQADYDADAEAGEDSVLVMFPGYGLTMDAISAERPHAIAQILLGSILMISDRLKGINRITAENMSWVEELRRRAYEDPGTGLWKQSFLTDEIGNILASPSALIQLKPDRFKILVDSRGHAVGDEAMVRIAKVLKGAVRDIGRGWPMRFKSNEVGLFIPRCEAAEAEKIAAGLYSSIATLEPVPPLGEFPAFNFSATVTWSVWPEDDENWNSLFEQNYTLLLDTWRTGGGILHSVARAAPPLPAGRSGNGPEEAPAEAAS